MIQMIQMKRWVFGFLFWVFFGFFLGFFFGVFFGVFFWVFFWVFFLGFFVGFFLGFLFGGFFRVFFVERCGEEVERRRGWRWRAVGRAVDHILEHAGARLALCCYWVLVMLLPLRWLRRLASRKRVAHILVRKYYHLMATAMFAPALVMQVGVGLLSLSAAGCTRRLGKKVVK